jgi:anthranilate phosphoribosyltransferase
LMGMREFVEKVQQKKNLTHGEMHALMMEIMSGRAVESDIRDFLVALNAKGFTVEEITAAAQIMRKFVVLLETRHEVVLDTCGTGGDSKGTFNISTAVAFVVAACGVIVAKHGNRSVSSHSGSADVLEALGVNLQMPHEKMSACLDEVGICFMFAQRHHPAMKHVAAVRKALGVKTIFNVLGPLTNPARATHQMVGVYNKHLTEQFAQVLKVLGAERAVAVHGADGLDEISTAASTFISEYNGKDILSYEIAPEDFGIKRVSESDLKGGDPAANAGLMLSILQGKGVSAHMDVVALNAGFALYAAQAVQSPREGLERVRQIMAQGKPLEKLQQFVEFSNRGQ